MKVHLKIVGFCGIKKQNEEVFLEEGTRVKNIIRGLSEEDEMFRKGMEKNYIVIMKNGISIEYLQGIETLLNDGDDLLIMPMQFGG